jgi:hypothetical protein
VRKVGCAFRQERAGRPAVPTDGHTEATLVTDNPNSESRLN